MIRTGILNKNDEILVSHIQNIEYAYVIFNPFRQKYLPSILDYFKKQGIYSIGRYGAWEHTSMEDAIFQGKQTALDLMDGRLGGG